MANSNKAILALVLFAMIISFMSVVSSDARLLSEWKLANRANKSIRESQQSFGKLGSQKRAISYMSVVSSDARLLSEWKSANRANKSIRESQQSLGKLGSQKRLSPGGPDPQHH
ncbi:cLAVATA3/ESR-related protein 6 [Striga asiatica]|uniref:CLAVATA3/ESR-related protein 6 n=1 Tax=Striga asiatica TaxID=4170 RepID=A0A5A7R8Q2_STRAF|nr:cLAVATA3/ESR-related protein 6 [Striga asiatica]